MKPSARKGGEEPAEDLLERWAGEEFDEVLGACEELVGAPVEPVGHLLPRREGHGQRHRAARRQRRGVGFHVEGVDVKVAADHRGGAWPEADVVVARHRAELLRAGAEPAPHRAARQAGLTGQPVGAGQHSPDAVAGRPTHRGEPLPRSLVRVGEAKERIGAELVGTGVEHAPDVLLPGGLGLAGEREHEVHVDRGEAGPACPPDRVERGGSVVGAAQSLQEVVGQRLGADRDHGDAGSAQPFQTLVVHLARVQLDANLVHRADGAGEVTEDPLEPAGVHGGRAAAHVERAEPRSGERRGQEVDLLPDRPLVAPVAVHLELEAVVRAEWAEVLAERDVKVEAGALQRGGPGNATRGEAHALPLAGDRPVEERLPESVAEHAQPPSRRGG
jgi:hypothetical protein